MHGQKYFVICSVVVLFHQVHQAVGKPLVEASMTGLNSILMAYGQTGAGLLLSFLIFHNASLER